MAEKNYKEGFNKGWGQLQTKGVPQVKEELLVALGINNRVSLSHYKTGKLEPKASQAAAVESVFNKYGITEVWGK
ncbi:MAG: hypothetical protein LIO65_07105 [Odoribacter sp.]|nr:hypothetical protein [Odoribacter sp.]